MEGFTYPTSISCFSGNTQSSVYALDVRGKREEVEQDECYHQLYKASARLTPCGWAHAQDITESKLV